MNRKCSRITIISAVLIIAGLAGLLILSVSKNSAAVSQTEEREIIRMAVYGDDTLHGIAADAAQEFMTENNCIVQISCYSSLEEEMEQVIGQMAGGTWFDLFYVDTENMKFLAESGRLSELTDIVENIESEGDIFYPGVLKTGQVSGMQYAVPSSVTPYELYYNENLLSDLQMTDPQDLFKNNQWTPENCAAYLREIASRSGDTALIAVKTWPVIAAYLRSTGASLTDIEAGNITEQIEESRELWNQLILDGTMEMTEKSMFQEAVQKFCDGELPFLIGDIELTSLCSSVSFDWDIVPFPSAGSDFSNSSFDAPLLAAAEGEHTETTKKFLDYYVSTLGQKKRLENGEHALPSLQNIFFTSTENIRFPRHSDYYLLSISKGFPADTSDLTEDQRNAWMKYWEESEE